MAKKKNKLLSGYYDANTGTRITNANIVEDSSGWKIEKNKLDNLNTSTTLSSKEPTSKVRSKVMAPAPQVKMTIDSINNKINTNINQKIINGGIENEIHNMNMAHILETNDKKIDLSGKDKRGGTTPVSNYVDTGKKYGDYYYDNYETYKDVPIYENKGKYYLKTASGYQPIGRLDKNGNVKTNIDINSVENDNNNILNKTSFNKNEKIDILNKYEEDKKELEKAKKLGYKDNLTKITTQEYDNAQETFKKLQKDYKLSDKELETYIKNGELPVKKLAIYGDSMNAIKQEADQYRLKLDMGKIKQYDQKGFDISKQIYMDTNNMSDDEKQQYISYITGKKDPTQKSESSFFKTPLAFVDGYQFGDINKTVEGTFKNAGNTLVRGALNLGEGMLDTGENILGSAAEYRGDAKGETKKDVKIFNNNTWYTGYKKGNQNYWYDAKNDLLYDEDWNLIPSFNLDRFEKRYNYSDSMAEFGRKLKVHSNEEITDRFMKDFLNDDMYRRESVLGTKSEAMLESMGQALPLMGAGATVGGLYGEGAAVATTSGLTFASTYGNAKTEAIRNGATEKEAMQTAFVQATAETISEQFFDAIPGAKSAGWGEKLVGKVGNSVEKYMGSRTAKIVTKALDISGEGFEEIISNMLTAGGNDIVHFIDKDFTYGMENQSGNILDDMTKAMTSQDSMDSFISAIITSALLNAGSSKINSSNENQIINEIVRTYAKEYNMSIDEAKNRLKINGDNIEFDTSNINQNQNTPNLPNNSSVEQRNINNNINSQIGDNVQNSMDTVQNNNISKNNNYLHNSYNFSDDLINEIWNKTKNNFFGDNDVKFVQINSLLPYMESGGFRETKKIKILEQQIKEKGINTPIQLLVDENGKIQIYNGNHRLDIANKFGLDYVPVKYINKHYSIENLEKSSDVLYNENEKGEEKNAGTRNYAEVQYNKIAEATRGLNDRSEFIEENGINDFKLDENTGNGKGNVGIYTEAQRVYNRSSSSPTTSRNGTIRELDNSSFSNEKSISNKQIAPINPNAITNQNKVKPPIAKEYQKNTIEEKIEKSDTSDVLEIKTKPIAPIVEDKINRKIETSSVNSINNATRVANKYLDLSREEKQLFQGKLKKYENKTYEEFSNGKVYNEIKDMVRDFSSRPIENIDEEMKSVKKNIRNRNIKIDDNLKSQITDYNDFRKSMFGKLKLSNNGISIDSLYNELSNSYPYYFDSNISTEADMLYELADFMDKSVVDIQRYNLSEKEIDDCTSKVFNELKNGLISDDKIQEIKDNINSKKNKLTRKEVREQLLSEMNLTPEELSIGADIKAFNFQITDPIRVNEKVFGYEIGRKVNEATIGKTKHNEAEKIRWLNSEKGDIKELGIKPRSKESAAVQKYGEKKYVNKYNEVVEYGDKQLMAEFPNVKTQEKIKRAAEMLRNKYDKYIDKMNEILTSLGYDEIPKRTDYMRHFQELGDIFSQTGVPFNLNDMAAEDLPTDINGLTEFNRPGKNWFASAQKRYGIKTTYDAITGIDGYLEGAANIIFHTEDIQRYRALSGLIRDNFGKAKGFENLDNLSNEEALKRIDDIQHNKLSKYVAWLDEQANNLAGKKGADDRGFERKFGRRGYTFLNTIKKQVGSNMTGFNVRSAMTNFISSTIAASKTNKIAMVKGTIATINNMFHDDGFINKSDFLTSRFGSDSLSPKLWNKISNAGQILMKGSDYFTSNQIVRSKYYEGLQKGMNETEAIKYADDFGARVMGDRSKGATAEIFNSKTLGILTQFQLETNNQWQFMIHDSKMDYQKNSKINGGLKAGATVLFQLGQLCAYSYFFNEIFEKLAGSRAALDPIDILLKLLGWGDDDEDKTFEKRMKEAGKELVESIPFAGLFGKGGRMPISDAITPFETTYDYITGKKNSYGGDITLKDVKNDTLGALPYYFLPTGYGQIKKTVKGLSMFSDDKEIKGSYSASGRLRFPVKDTIGNKVKAGLFGEYASREAKEYFNNSEKPLTDNQQNMFETLNIPISDYWVITKDLSTLKKKLKGKKTDERKKALYKYIDSLDVSQVRKDILKKSEYKTYTDGDNRIIKYINNSNMSKKSKDEILKKLGLDK